MALAREARMDVVVVGGGLGGLLAANPREGESPSVVFREVHSILATRKMTGIRFAAA
jgi:flavin-dependent dehydrogenase